MTRVSYIMATRNRADYFERVLVNVREYLTPDDEFIVCDGQSTDGTLDVIARNRDVVTDFVSEKDVSESHALNKGILRARGRWIKLLTDDDYTHPEAMRKVIETLEANPTIDAIQCGGEHWEIDATSGERRFKYFAWFPPGAAWAGDLRNVYRSKVACGLGLLFSPRILTQVGLLDTSYVAMDTEYIMRIMAHRLDYRFLAVMLYRHTTYPHSVIANQDKARRDRIRLMLRALTWDPESRDADYPLREIAADLGVSDLEIERFATFLWMRGQERGAWKDAARAGLGAGRTAWALWQRMRPGGEKARAAAEPIWDGSLR
jgi:glycosyltransferase involved in cell wall biosynthesis